MVKNQSRDAAEINRECGHLTVYIICRPRRGTMFCNIFFCVFFFSCLGL